MLSDEGMRMIIEPPVTQRVEATGSHRRMFLSFLFVIFILCIYLFSERIPGMDTEVFRIILGDLLKMSFTLLIVLGLFIIMWIRYPVYLGFDERNLYLKRRNGLQVFALDELDWFTCESVKEIPQYRNPILRALFSPVFTIQQQNMPRYLRPVVRLAFSHRGTDHELSRMIPLKEACALARKFVPADKMITNEQARKLIWSDLGYYLRGSLRRPEFVFLYIICAAAPAGYVFWSVLR